MRRLFLAALLAYVALELSLCEMPGAFVFDPAESVETVDSSRTRPTNKPVALPIPVPGSSLSVRELLEDPDHRPARIAETEPARRFVVSYLPRAVCCQPPLSEDPH
jgi:hypothetical protein